MPASNKMTSVKSTAAQQYFENSSMQKDHADELLDMLNVPEGGLVLDLGCGTGHLATVLSHLVGPHGKVVAVDPDADRIALAKKNNARPNIEYLVANDQSFPGEGYDLIISIHVVHWIKHKRAALTRIYNKLAPGGKFGFVTFDGTPYNPQAISEGLSILVSTEFEYDLICRRMTFEKQQYYETTAANIGFETVATKTVPKELGFESVSKFLDYWAGVSHGGFDVKDISKQKIQSYKKNHETELLAATIHLPTLCMALKK